MAKSSESIVVFAPRGRNGELTRKLLEEARLECIVCSSGAELVERIRAGAGCAIMTAETIDRPLHDQLAAHLAKQPAWSDFPIIMLAESAPKMRDSHLELGNVTILERPVAAATLLAAAQSALRARRRQYEAFAAIRARDQFLAMLGHELRNPLAAIVLASEALPDDHASIPVLQKRLAIVSRHANHVSKLVNDLLDVARVASGKLALQLEAVEVDDTIRNCIAALESRAKDRGITFEWQQPSGLTIEADPGRLEQVISNLLTNAVKYSPPNRVITITSVRAGDDCEIRVRDHGIGIAPEMLPRVFDLFAQADSSLARSEGGLGVGLALVQQLVQMHGGSVAATSVGLGEGSEFVVRLPLGSPHAKECVEQAVPVSSADALRVVIVEDNPDLLALTEAVVREFGCETETASDGESGLARIVANKPDLALVDVGLPKLDGYGVALGVRRQLANPPTLVAITGYGQRSDRERALAAGFDEHVTKPIRSETLQRLVEGARARTRKIKIG
ncbi:MAG TPA: hybrid sensor histidine kinase/response regulator [Kofleriaceae bacterium]|jgi:signal transduction histidine kinase/ActR/RegA family two-component response regulator